MGRNEFWANLEKHFRYVKGRKLVNKGIPVIWNPITYSDVAGLHGTSIENLVRIVRAGKVFPRTEKTKVHKEDYVDRIHIVPFPEAFENHALRDQLNPVSPEKVVNAALNYAAITAFYSYFNQIMPFVIDDTSYVSTILLPGSGMADNAIEKMRGRAIEFGYSIRRFKEVFDAASNRKGVVLAIGIQTLSYWNYYDGELNPGREVYIRTRKGLPLEDVVGIEIIDPLEREEFFKTL